MTPNLVGTKYLVGIDFSADCERALLYAVKLAEENDAQLELVHVFEWDTDGTARGSTTDEEPVGAKLLQAACVQAKVFLQRLAQLCSDLVADRVPAKIHVLVGDPATEVLQAAAQLGPALIVLGAFGRRPLPRGAVGTTAERVCEKSSIPVLVVPPISLSGQQAQINTGAMWRR